MIKRPSKMPKWQDCQWRRVACGKNTCKICGRINSARKMHIIKGEDPDSLKSVFVDVSETFKETKELLLEKAEELGIDLTNLDDVEEEEEADFSQNVLYKKLMAWRRNVSKVIAKGESDREKWLRTDSGQDLVWYMSTVVVKTCRLLSGLWDIEQGDEYMDLEVSYTAYVLSECVQIIKTALTELRKMDSRCKLDFIFLHDEFEPLSGEVLALIEKAKSKV